MNRSFLTKIGCLGVAAGVTSVFFIQYCDLLFACGCQAHWAAAADHCNIHNAEPPHCPWCIQDSASGRWSFRLTIASQAILALWPGRLGRIRAALVFLAFPVVGAAGAIAAGLTTGYWM